MAERGIYPIRTAHDNFTALTSMASILIIEDDLSLAETMSQSLSLLRHTVEHAKNGEDGLISLRESTYDVIVLDWQLPGISGVEICKLFRSAGGTTPILMLTGKNKLMDKEIGFESGVDDYLTKPFHIRELSLRVQALLRRLTQPVTTSLRAGDLVLTAESFTVTKAGKPIRLKPKEFTLLEFLLRHKDIVFSSDDLLQKFWADDNASVESLRVQIARLRSKIETTDKGPFIHTIVGRGYKLSDEQP